MAHRRIVLISPSPNWSWIKLWYPLRKSEKWIGSCVGRWGVGSDVGKGIATIVAWSKTQRPLGTKHSTSTLIILYIYFHATWYTLPRSYNRHSLQNVSCLIVWRPNGWIFSHSRFLSQNTLCCCDNDTREKKKNHWKSV